MKILFVSSGNSKTGISPIILNQGNSLSRLGHKVVYYTIKGKGIKGYGKSTFKLKKYLNKNNFDIIHAHYSLSAMVATIAGAKPLVVSLMGSDVKAKGYSKNLIFLFSIFFWKTVIVKSEEMKASLGLEDLSIIPNGVDLKRFQTTTKIEAQNRFEWLNTHKHILFAANPDRPVKNFDLAKQAVNQLKVEYPEIELHVLKGQKHEDVPLMMNASDVVVLSSFREGSPNVIKEAMACNVPIVATDVGDIKWLFGELSGYYLSDFNAFEMKNKLVQALNYKNKTEGRERILNLGLDDQSIAQRIINIYKSIIND